MKEYKCPHCGEKIKKGINKCPACEKDIFWMPVASEIKSEECEIKTIKSRAYVRTGSTTNRIILEKKISEKLFSQMFEVVAKLWRIDHFIDNGLEGYEASLDVVKNNSGRTVTISKPLPKVSTAKTATRVAKESLVRAPISTQAPPTEYDKMVSKEPKHPYHRPDPKPEFLEFQQRLKQSTMQIPSQVQTVNDNGDFTQNIF